MSLIFADALAAALKAQDNAAVVSILEPRVLESSATERETLLCGVLMMMPPIVECEAAANIFGRLLHGDRCFEAAVWDAYLFANLFPEGDRSFEVVLQKFPGSAVSAHMLSMVAECCNFSSRALDLNRESRRLRLFPFNIVEGIKRDPELKPDEKSMLWYSASDLIISRTAEVDAPALTVEGALQRRWDNLIVGTRVTSQLWSTYIKLLD